MQMDLTWDEAKNERNYEKHGIWFEEAATVIVNPLSLVASNDHSEGDRMEYLGHSLESRILYVVTAEASADTVRIISARKATAQERRKYEEKGI